MTRLAIFDCDGTLVDSGATIHSALAQTFERHGRPLPPRDGTKRVVGLSLDQAMAMLAPDADAAEHKRLSGTYRDVFIAMRQAGQVEEPLFDGIAELLDRLEEDGWLLAVATGKSDRGLRHCLQSHGLHARFLSLQTADRHPSKPDPSMALTAIAECGSSPERSIVIGDTGWDMGMARAAGAGALGAAWGYHSEAELLAGGAQAIAQGPANVATLAGVLIQEGVR
ncbi:HAD hydrolase-like protein [Sphingomonas sp. GCM10030256]|uniref:HAD hydrolase-like protein n=1 Tax=Sphingomonas sp. GCM10030256 TaxID=3273427 RepID=UPI00361EF781